MGPDVPGGASRRFAPRSRQHARPAAWWLALAAVALVGCPNGRIDAPTDALDDASVVLERAKARAAAVRTLSVDGRASYYDADRAVKGAVGLVASRPGKVYFAAFTPGGDLVSAVATDGERFTAFERGNPQCYEGPACAENIARFLRIGLEPAELVDVLLGGAAIVPHAERDLAWDRAVGAYRLTLRGTDARGRAVVQDVWVRHGTFDVVAATVRRDGELVVDVRYEDAEPAGPDRVLVPRTLRVTMPKGDVDMKLVYRELDVNEPVSEEAFTMRCPEGTTAVPLPCLE